MLPCLFAAALAYDGYYRTPDLHGDTLLFSAEGDLWTVPTTGGTARRVTSQPGGDGSAHISPDGRTIAYTSDIDGGVDVYVIDLMGGEPRRLTWNPTADEVIGWTPDGQVLFRSDRYDPMEIRHIFRVSPAGGEPEELPIGWAARLSIDPATGWYAFTRLGAEQATWKRYRGGRADDIWVGDPKVGTYAEITTFEGADSWPMWGGGRVWFLSDQGGTANLWSMRPDGTDRRRHTSFTEWDIRQPNIAPDGRITFTLAADVYLFDPRTDRATKVPIDLPGERRQTRVRYPWAQGWLEWAELSPNGDRVAVVARGELFSVPTDDGVTLPISHTDGARERNVIFDPTGQKMIYVTDASGEMAIESRDAWGRGSPTTLVAPVTRGWIYAPAISPDGKTIAWSDDTHALWTAPVSGGTPRQLDRASQGEILDYVWSPDGRYLAWSWLDAKDISHLRVFDAKTSETHELSTGTTNDYGPAWDPDGRYLYFLSSRAVNPFVSLRDYQIAESRVDVPCAFLLRRDVAHPFADNAGLPPAPSNPSAQAAGEKARKDKVKKDKKDKEKDLETTEQPLTPITIEWDGLLDRQVEFPVSPGNYGALSATGAFVYWLTMPSGRGPQDPPGQTDLIAFSLEDQEESTFASNVQSYDLPLRADKMLVIVHNTIYTTPVGSSASLSDALPLTGLGIDLDPQQEWRQIFFEAWRMQRDFFWDPLMGGLDWPAIRDQYATLLPRVSSRGELVDLIGEMIGELGTSHTYVWGGDGGAPGSVPVGNGTLGCRVVREGSAFKVTRIWRGDPADRVSNPLLEPGAAVKEGEYLLAINHRPFDGKLPFEAYLAGLADRRVLLTVGPKADGSGSREVAITVRGRDADLRYADQIRRNREYVSSRTGGRVGYIHLPDMGTEGLVAFETWSYSQADRDGLIVDVRNNGGGNVSQILLEKLRRPIHGFDVTRHGSQWSYPSAVRRGPFVVITNEFAGSDGDIFPTAVQAEGLAPVIGERSWGGVVGIRMDRMLVDNGLVTFPEFAFWFRDQGWGVENRGVIPDIEVPWLPQDVASGSDSQLDAAIAETLRLIKEFPPLQPDLGPRPPKSRTSYEDELKP